jgi:hypothetical protein
MLKEYLAIRDISERPVGLAVDALVAVAGDREISDVIDAAACTFLHEWREADLRCVCETWFHRMRKQTFGSMRLFQPQLTTAKNPIGPMLRGA